MGSFIRVFFLQSAGLYFRGQRIWQAAMDDLMAQGMRYANQVLILPQLIMFSLALDFGNNLCFLATTQFYQALLSGCSAGGVSTILHCDEFRGLFSGSTNVKCLADAGMFLDL